jgi:heat-inducible transcriptional repressor
MAAARGPEEIAERAGRVLARISRGLGIVVAPPIGKAVVEHLRFVLLPDMRVLAIVIGPGGATRDKVLHTQRRFAQEELDRTSDYLNRHYSGWTLAAIREDLLANLAKDRERYDGLTATALTLCDPQLLADTTTGQVLVEGTAQMAATPEFSGQGQFQELLFAIEEKHKLVALLNNCIDSPEPVLVQIGLGEIATDGSNLALISAPYTAHDQVQGSLGVLGPTRMQYERAITAVAYVARLYSETLDRS